VLLLEVYHCTAAVMCSQQVLRSAVTAIQHTHNWQQLALRFSAEQLTMLFTVCSVIRTARESSKSVRSGTSSQLSKSSVAIQLHTDMSTAVCSVCGKRSPEG
jgi:hypothetical protein